MSDIMQAILFYREDTAVPCSLHRFTVQRIRVADRSKHLNPDSSYTARSKRRLNEVWCLVQARGKQEKYVFGGHNRQTGSCDSFNEPKTTTFSTSETNGEEARSDWLPEATNSIVYYFSMN